MARPLPPHPMLPLRNLRLAAGHSQERLAVLAGLTGQTIWRLETKPSAYAHMSTDTLRRIAEALGVPILTICPWFATATPFPPTDPPADLTPAQ